MKIYANSIELQNISSRTRKMVWVSAAVHAAIILWMILYRTVSPPPPAITEISWIEPAPVQVSKPVAAARPKVEKRREEIPAPRQKQEHFVRKTSSSDFAPQPQTDRTADDRLRRKLSSMQDKALKKNTTIAGIADARNITRPRLASAPSSSSNNQSVQLDRKVRSSAPAVLNRSQPVRKSSMNITQVPEKKVTRAKIEESESTAKRILDGARLTGPVADRNLITHRMPQYPEWAKRDGVEASVSLYFIVLPSGEVKENILVQKTSGFGDFDDRAVAALRQWKFEPLSGGKTGEQWGSITFNFRLKG